MYVSSDGDDRSADGPDTGTLSHRYDWSSTRPSTAIVELVAIAADREPSALEPLYDSLDPEALDQLIRRDGDDEVDDGVERQVSLSYSGYHVTVRSDGEVSVTPDDRPIEEE